MKDPLLDEVRGMLIFARVVDSGSLAEAARRLGVSRAVVSYQLKRLEGRLGLRLLNRSTRRIGLTAAGQRYHESCRRIANEAERAQRFARSLREEAVGRVVVACPIHLGLRWVVPAIDAFRRRYPRVDLDLRFSETVAHVIEEGVDLAIRAGPLPDSDLRSTRLATFGRRLCASPDYVERRGWPRRAEDLEGHDWVVYTRGAPTFTLRHDGVDHRIPVRGGLRTDSAAARLRFVLAGHGLGLLPAYDADEAIAGGSLVQLLPDAALPTLDLFAVFPAGSTDARASRLLLDALREGAASLET